MRGSPQGSLLCLIPTQQFGVVLVDASFTIHTRGGDLTFALEQVAYNMSPSGNGEFSALGDVTDGTGRTRGPRKYVHAAGNQPLSTGVVTGTTSGRSRSAEADSDAARCANAPRGESSIFAPFGRRKEEAELRAHLAPVRS